VNEIAWDTTGSLFYLTTGQGTVVVLDDKMTQPYHVVRAHTANCYCIAFDPSGRYVARALKGIVVHV
jgi:THO complex subunit 3